MLLSRDARLVSAITLLVVPTIMYGGWTLLGLLTHGTVVARPNIRLDETQWALWRAGHAHAGVWTILSLLLQIFLDSARLSVAAKWLARICAPLAAVFLSAGFFGVAVSVSFRWLIYLGVLSMVTALLLTVLGLIRDLRVEAGAPRSLQRSQS
ncbi:MAG TPA: hypothetical protein VKB72_03370 [Steroidobacteraceae bacterium]|nr:hypothetical protein [Steroidobacteraceae bacterium]